MSRESLDLAVEAASLQPSSEIALAPKGPEIFSRENLIKAGRIAAATALIVVVPGAGVAAAVTGAVWLANRMKSQRK